MNYQIHITQAAENDINEAADYIAYSLMNVPAAERLLDEIEQEIPKLSEFANQHAVIDDPVLKSWGMRFLKIGNYLTFYIVNEREKKVHILRFLYEKRDWIHILKFSK